MTERPCGAGAPAREMPEAKVDKARTDKSSANKMLAPIFRRFQLISAALQEIFDESAYQRFLDRTHLKSSPNAYAVFRQENEQAKSRRPRCC
jgi:hypothetical protein